MKCARELQGTEKISKNNDQVKNKNTPEEEKERQPDE